MIRYAPVSWCWHSLAVGKKARFENSAKAKQSAGKKISYKFQAIGFTMAWHCEYRYEKSELFRLEFIPNCIRAIQLHNPYTQVRIMKSCYFCLCLFFLHWKDDGKKVGMEAECFSIGFTTACKTDKKRKHFLLSILHAYSNYPVWRKSGKAENRIEIHQIGEQWNEQQQQKPTPPTISRNS